MQFTGSTQISGFIGASCEYKEHELAHFYWWAAQKSVQEKVTLGGSCYVIPGNLPTILHLFGGHI